MPDADLRALERQARAGDPEATARLKRARRRTEAPLPAPQGSWWRFDYGGLEQRILLSGRQQGKTLASILAYAGEVRNLKDMARQELELVPFPPPVDPRTPQEAAAERLLGGLRRPSWWPAR